MKKLLLSISLFVSVAFIAHGITLYAVPGIIMNQAMMKMGARGIGLNQAVLSPKLTPQTQTVVRPSPDLAYTICRFDFDHSPQPLEIFATAWDGYGSVSFFDARTNNFATVRITPSKTHRRADGVDGVNLLLTGPALQATKISGAQEISSPSNKGLILFRRLAPTAKTYAEVERLAVTDRCGYSIEAG